MMEFIVKNGIYVDAREINNAITNAPAIEQGDVAVIVIRVTKG